MGSLSRNILLRQWTSLSICTKCSSCTPVIRSFSNKLDNHFRQQPSSSYDAQQRHYSSSKTDATETSTSLEPLSDANKSLEQSIEATLPPVPYFSGYDIRELDPDTKSKIHSVSSAVAKAQAASLLANTRTRRRKEILIMDESEYKGKAILQNKPSLLDRRGEAETFFLKQMGPEKFNGTDLLCTVQADIDLRPEAVKRWWKQKQLEQQIELQKYNPKRTKILGNDLAAAHVIVARGGKVKFLGHKTWVTQYRKDAKPGVPEEDLPVMKFELCTLPINYDPRYRLEAIDASGVELHYEGLENFENLHHVKWLSLRNSPYINDWCLDRISRQLGDSLQFIDLSGCKNVTDKGIGALHSCSKLQVIVAEDMGHLENLEIVSALLEEHNPNVEVIGVDYEAKTAQLRLEAEELELKAKQIHAGNVGPTLSLPSPTTENELEKTENSQSITARTQ